MTFVRLFSTKSVINRHLSFLLSLCFLATAFVSNAQKKENIVINYYISPLKSDSVLRLKITAEIITSNTHSTRIELPKGYGAQNSFEKCISGLRVVSENCQLSNTDSSYIKIVTHKPGQKIRFEYIFSNVSSLSQEENQEADILPQFTDDSFWFSGLSCWIIPLYSQNPDYTAAVTLNWQDFPDDFKLANSFGFGQRKQFFKGPVADFTQTGFIGGNDYRYITFKLKNKPVTVAVYNELNLTDSDLENSIRKILQTENVFWNDFSFSHYFISIISPYNGNENSNASGTSGKNAFFATAGKHTTLGTINSIFAHEIFHNWNPIKLGRSIDPKPTWFTEGFTNYYTYQILLNCGLTDPAGMVKEYNKRFVSYFNSEVINANLDTMQRYFFSDYRYQSLPYNKGLLLAMQWDYELKNKSGGKVTLQTVLKKMFRDSKKESLELSTENICSYVSIYIGRDVLPEVNDSWVDGKTINFNYDMQLPFIEVRKKVTGKFDIGFNTHQTYSTKIISGVSETSNAYQAGLRNGMALIDDFYAQNDPTKKATVIVNEGGEEKRIVYFPAGVGVTEIPELVLKEALTEQEKNEIVHYFAFK